MTVAIDARGHRLIDLRMVSFRASSQAESVATGPILFFLVSSCRRIILPHVIDVGMATPAKARDPIPRVQLVKRGIVTVVFEGGENWAPAMTIVTAEPLLPMNIV